MSYNQISIVILNYNVEHFLAQTLRSVKAAITNLNAEVWVVDNASSDGSVENIKTNFPWVKIIANNKNLGFSKGNNIALKQCNGKYILLLNPDTMVAEDTFEKCIQFAETAPKFGSLGVKMIDGSGQFLLESKRGLPTPAAAFFKMCGLAKIFPKNKLMGKYHLGFLNKNQNHAVDVLSGAFMFISKNVLNTVGLLDEDFFMYGEDIDLSFRIQKAGFLNYYFSETQILHYKGESTKRKSANYVRIFYQAMAIFTKKHFNNNGFSLLALFLKLAIWARASLAWFIRIAKVVGSPLIDFATVYLGFYAIATYWEKYNKFVTDFYPLSFYQYHLTGYTLILLFICYLSGAYDKPLSYKRLIRGGFLGSVALFSIYAFLPKSLQFSRAIIGLGSMWLIIALPILRELGYFINNKKFGAGTSASLRLAVLGNYDNFLHTQQILQNSKTKTNVLIWINTSNLPNSNADGDLQNLKSLVDLYAINHFLFCEQSMPYKSIIDIMNSWSKKNIQFKMGSLHSNAILGSSNKNNQGNIIGSNAQFSIATNACKRKKRLFDIGTSIAIIALLPLFVFIKPKAIIQSFAVLLGINTWISYMPNTQTNLPKIKNGFILPNNNFTNPIFMQKANYMYAVEYSVYKDIKILKSHLF